jgi:hypothetical protein
MIATRTNGTLCSVSGNAFNRMVSCVLSCDNDCSWPRPEHAVSRDKGAELSADHRLWHLPHPRMFDLAVQRTGATAPTTPLCAVASDPVMCTDGSQSTTVARW